MAQPTTRKFGQFKVYLGDGATPELFATPCGFTERALSITSDLTDTTLPDCDDEDAAAWTGRDVRAKSWGVTGAGVMAMEALATWRNFALATTAKSVRIEFSGTGAQGGGYFEGSAHCASFEVSATLGEKVQISVDLQGDGELAWVAAA